MVFDTEPRKVAARIVLITPQHNDQFHMNNEISVPLEDITVTCAF